MYSSMTPLPHAARLAALALALPLAAWAADSQVQMDQKANDTVIYLGKIGITGHRAIIETLQGIKVSLKQPLSTDPKLADVMVCRLDAVAGSNTKQWLTCATNRVLNTQHAVMRSTLQSGLNGTNGRGGGDSGKPSDPRCTTADCYGEALAVFNETIDDQPGKFLHVQVNSSALLGLLDRLPDPARGAVSTLAPQAATLQAPISSTTRAAVPAQAPVAAPPAVTRA